MKQPDASVALNVNDVPAPLLAVGVPLRTPPVLRLRPVGNVPVDNVHVYGAVPPEAAIVCEYTAPTVPTVSDAGVNVIVGQEGTSV